MFQPFNLQPPKIDPFKERARKQAREKLSRVAQQYRVTWKEVLDIAMKTFGKDRGFSINECETLIKEIKKGGYRTMAEHLREHLEAVSKHSINQSNQYDAHDKSERVPIKQITNLLGNPLGKGAVRRTKR
jgi:replication initiation and membrane attachment protein DnaB